MYRTLSERKRKRAQPTPPPESGRKGEREILLSRAACVGATSQYSVCGVRVPPPPPEAVAATAARLWSDRRLRTHSIGDVAKNNQPGLGEDDDDDKSAVLVGVG